MSSIIDVHTGVVPYSPTSLETLAFFTVPMGTKGNRRRHSAGCLSPGAVHSLAATDWSHAASEDPRAPPTASKQPQLPPLHPRAPPPQQQPQQQSQQQRPPALSPASGDWQPPALALPPHRLAELTAGEAAATTAATSLPMPSETRPADLLTGGPQPVPRDQAQEPSHNSPIVARTLDFDGEVTFESALAEDVLPLADLAPHGSLPFAGPSGDCFASAVCGDTSC